MPDSPVLHPLQPIGSTSSARRWRHTPAGSSSLVTPQLVARESSSYFPPDHAIPSVKPIVDARDRLWAEIDVLDDVAVMAQQAKANRSFFGAAHAQALADLKAEQTRLVRAMTDLNQTVEAEEYGRVWENNNLEGLRKTLFDSRPFATISDSVDKTMVQLDKVAESMSHLEDHSRDFWQHS